MNKILITITILILGGFALGQVDLGQVDERTDTYVDKATHYELALASDIPQGERVEIRKDKAQMDLVFWNDEERISIIPQIPTRDLGATRRDFITEANRSAEKVEYRSGDTTVFIEPKSENEFDIDFTLDVKPDTNVFEYKIEGAENFDFFYQPTLTQEEIDERAERPENVIGSYAVYHKTKKDNRVESTNYATGKVFHIYRPKAIDANGTEQWADLSYENGVLTVTVSQRFLDEALYPVVVDPTFGLTSLGASNNWATIARNSSGNEQSCTDGQTYNLSEDGTLDSIHLGLTTLTGDGEQTLTVTASLHREDSAGANIHDLVVGVEADVTIDETAAFETFNASSEALTSDDYVIGGLGDWEDLSGLGIQVYLKNDTAASIRNYHECTGGAGAYATRKAEDPWTEVDSSTTNRLSFYATYSVPVVADDTHEGQLEVKSGNLIIKSGKAWLKN